MEKHLFFITDRSDTGYIEMFTSYRKALKKALILTGREKEFSDYIGKFAENQQHNISTVTIPSKKSGKQTYAIYWL